MSADGKELEIKFAGAAAELTALPDSDFMAALTRGEGAWERLETRYYDTPDGDLAARGISLRRRVAGGREIQTVKRKSAGGLVARDEWERETEPGEAFPALTGVCDVDVLLTTLAERLRPTMAIDVDRWACEFPFRESMLEVAVDIGVSKIADEAGEGAPRFLGELELELIGGDPRDLFAAAKLVLINTGLRLHARSKLDAAKVAASPEGAAAIPPRPSFKFDGSETAGAVLQQALIAIAERMIGIQPAILDARAVEGVHQMRVELRRFRAIERVFRRAVGETQALARLASRAKMTARALGPARDWDVFIGETLPFAAQHDYASEGFAALKAKAHALRAEAWGRAAGVIGAPGFSQFLLDLLEAAHGAPWLREGDEKTFRASARSFAEKALDRAARKARKTARNMDHESLAARHPLRIALKKQRYAVQLFRSLYPKDRRKPYMATMSALQEAFGVVNDGVVAQGLAEKAAAGAGPQAMRAAGFIGGYHAARAEAAVKEIDAAWSRFETMTPFWREYEEMAAGSPASEPLGEKEC